MDEDKAKSLIIDGASELFFKFGFSNTTTQQIAEELEISKKTIYKYFPSKESLLEAVLEREHLEMEAQLSQLVNQDDLDFLEKTRQLSELLVFGNSKFGPQFVKELQRYKFSNWSYHCHAHHRLLVYFEKLLHQGIEQGFIREETNLPVVLLIIDCLQGHLNFDKLSQMDMSLNQAIDEIIQVIMNGIITDTGRERLAKAGRL
ncbi:TetR family transcriptional regulator [Hydrogenispora ethanolica]|uniref:TetR family transcriptional regulator n=2 Tax=Hydrogenispora ethanolica TaxID=1082276 RepID=A0A4R1SBB7_HYDET|nr:TetR family transcriptional regulator [Hydrogenispora ethanolica]